MISVLGLFDTHLSQLLAPSRVHFLVLDQLPHILHHKFPNPKLSCRPHSPAPFVGRPKNLETWACSCSGRAALEDAVVAGGVAGGVRAMACRAALIHRDVEGTGLASSP